MTLLLTYLLYTKIIETRYICFVCNPLLDFFCIVVLVEGQEKRITIINTFNYRFKNEPQTYLCTPKYKQPLHQNTEQSLKSLLVKYKQLYD